MKIIFQKDKDVVENAVSDADLLEAASLRKRNEIMDEIVEKSKKHKKGKKSLTLLELHEKKLKKKKKVRKMTDVLIELAISLSFVGWNIINNSKTGNIE